MTIEEPRIPVPVRSGEFQAAGRDSRALRHDSARGGLVRLAPGAYLDVVTWGGLEPVERYALRVREHLVRLAPRLVASHWSAAAFWRMPVVDDWPSETQVIDPRRGSSSKTRLLLRRPGRLADHDITRLDGANVTSPVRTAVDLALTEGFQIGVLLFDHGLHTGLFTRDEAEAVLEGRTQARRHRAAVRALAFASEQAEYPGESFSRMSMAARGFPAPALQHGFQDRYGTMYVDFWWPEFGIAGEFDGDWKYSDPRFLKGRTPARAVADEKRRQSRLEAIGGVRRVVRWDYAVARDADELARRLLAAGLPRLNPRERHSRGA